MVASNKRKQLEELKILAQVYPLGREQLIAKAWDIYLAYAEGNLSLSTREKNLIYQIASMGEDTEYVLSAHELAEWIKIL